MSVRTASSVLKFSLKELENLVKKEESQVYLHKDVKYPLKLTPACLRNVNEAITEILTAERLKYIPKYKGLLLAFKHVRRHSNMGTINDDECNILIHVHVDLYIFAPTVGCTMTGVVSKVGEDDVGCLVHKGFNVTLPRPRNEGDAQWIGSTLQLGNHVRFRLDTFNVVGTLPYIRGTLLSLVARVGRVQSTELADACRMPKLERSAVKVEPSGSPKKKKKRAQGEDDADGSSTKKIKKRKSDPIAAPSLDSEPQGSTKKMKLASQLANEPYKSPLLRLLDASDGEGEASSAAKTASVKKTKKLKAARGETDDAASAESKPKAGKSLASESNDDAAEIKINVKTSAAKKRKAATKPKATEMIDEATKTKKPLKKAQIEQKLDAPTLDVSSPEKKMKKKSPTKEGLTVGIEDMSIDALMQRALENVGAKTPKSKKSRALLASENITKGTKETDVRLPDAKKPMNGEELKSAQKKKKTKADALSENSNKFTTPAKSVIVENLASLRDLINEDSDSPNTEVQLSKSTKKSRKTVKTGGPSESADSFKTPAKSVTIEKLSLKDLIHEDLDSPNVEVQLSKSTKKNKKQTKPSEPSEKVKDSKTPSKPVLSSAKRNCESSFSSVSHEIDDMADSLRSPKKKKTTKSSELPSASDASSKKKKRKSSQSSVAEDDATKGLLEKLLQQVSGSPKKQKKAKASEAPDGTASFKTPSKAVASESNSVKKNQKSTLNEVSLPTPAELLAKLQQKLSKSSKKNIKPVENGEIPSKSTKPPEISSSKKSKKILLDFLDEEEMPSVNPTEGKTPAKIRKAFVQSPIDSVSKTKTLKSKTPKSETSNSETPKTKTPKSETSKSETPKPKTPKSVAKTPMLPALPPLSSTTEVPSLKESPVKKQRKSGLGSSDLLQKLLNMEKSVHLESADESPTLSKSGKKKSKKTL